MTEKRIKQFTETFNLELNKEAQAKGLTPTTDNETLIILCDDVLTKLCKKESLELRKFILTIPHIDEETGEQRELETSFLVTDLKGQAVQFEISDFSELNNTRIGVAILTKEELQNSLKLLYKGNSIDQPINKEFIARLKTK